MNAVIGIYRPLPTHAGLRGDRIVANSVSDSSEFSRLACEPRRRAPAVTARERAG
jgi:hypothetical protein